MTTENAILVALASPKTFAELIVALPMQAPRDVDLCLNGLKRSGQVQFDPQTLKWSVAGG